MDVLSFLYIKKCFHFLGKNGIFVRSFCRLVCLFLVGGVCMINGLVMAGWMALIYSVTVASAANWSKPQK